MSLQRKHVLIIGSGFAGLAAARVLANTEVDVTIVDRTNHFLFQPLLYQVATATLAPSDIAVPIRWLARKHRGTTVLMGDVTTVELDARRVRLADGKVLGYDFLVVATGARHAYFGHDEWEASAPGLKTLDDATRIRERLLGAFEEAEASDDPAVREACLTIAIVGGGPTGVELAGIIPDIARRAIARDFRRIDTRRTRVVLVEAGPRLLTAFPDGLARQAQRDLEEVGVEVRTGTRVTGVEEGVVTLGDERLPARTIIWAAGNTASPLVRMLGAPVDRAGRVEVEADLSIPGRPEVFVVGDAAAARWKDGWVPGVAPAANQMGRHAATTILRTLRRQARRPFRYLDKGNLATIGRHRAIADFGHRIQFSGRPAWWLWLLIHIMYLAGFRNRVAVLVGWAYAYFTYERGVRLILGRTRDGVGAARPAPVEPVPGQSPPAERAAAAAARAEPLAPRW